MEILIVAAMLGGVVGMIARSKGRDFLPWWLYGTLLFVVAIVHVLLVRPVSADEERMAIGSGKLCPRCSERVKGGALVCRYCGHEFTEARAA